MRYSGFNKITLLLTDAQNKLINYIIGKLDLTAIVVKNDEVDSLFGGRTGETDEISAKSKNMKNLQRPDIWHNLSS